MPVLELLSALIRRPSVTPEDRGCQELIAERLSGAGFSVRRMPFGKVENLWATHGSGSPLICLAGHTDVVPPGPLDQWTSPPFEPTVRDGYLYGRGAADMKGSVAAMVVALERVATTGHTGTIALLLTSDEEGSGVDGTRRALSALLEERIIIDGAIVGEPTSERQFGDTFKVGRRGSTTGNLVVQGIQGHTAYPHLARNAVHMIAPALADLVQLDWVRENDLFPATTLQITNVQAGTGANNVVPGQCSVQFNVRFGTSQTPESIEKKVSERLKVHGIVDPVSWTTSALPFLTENSSLVAQLKSAVQAATGLTPTPSTGGGTSDARFFAAHGIPVVEFGPINASIHAIDECIEIACLEPLASCFETSLAVSR